MPMVLLRDAAVATTVKSMSHTPFHCPSMDILEDEERDLRDNVKKSAAKKRRSFQPCFNGKVS